MCVECLLTDCRLVGLLAVSLCVYVQCLECELTDCWLTGRALAGSMRVCVCLECLLITVGLLAVSYVS